MVTWHWHTEPGLLIGLLLLGWAYALLTGPLRERLFGPIPFPRWRACAFFAALAGTYLTVGSPLDQAGEDFLFWVHMVQHNLLMYVLPPLFIVGLPPWIPDRAFRWLPLRRAWALLTHPVLAGFALTFAFTIWHVPVLYEAALRSKPVHILEHVTIFVPSLWVCWSFFSPSVTLPARSYGLRILFVFVLMVAQIPVFGVLTLSGEVLYPTYAYAPRLPGWLAIDPLGDQVLGGVTMKIAGMIFALSLLLYSWMMWAYRSEETPDENNLAGEARRAHG